MPRNDAQETLEQQPRQRGVGVDDGAELLALPYVRFTQRGRSPHDRRRAWILLAAVLAAHLLLAWLAYLVLRPSPYARIEGGVVAVTLIEPTSGMPAPPPLVPPPPLPGQPPPQRLHYVPPAKGAMSATLEGVKGPPLELYQSNGQIRVPSGSSLKMTPAPTYRAPEIKGSRIYSGKSPIPYQPTRFDKAWAPANESLGGKLFDKAIDKTKIEKTVRLPTGGKIHCAINPLLALAGGLIGCAGEPPPPPPKNDHDIRLSMPPPETLTGKKVPVPESAPSTLPASSGSN